ncbi:MAG TPA: serine/threonine-protein kinase [Polyangiaceae bacterium LLY-WYZ-15_(1-7)]|nr:serine/threonine-protein kinase [Polyangiaceae bacterium LLY-WYZ-15_(1-7)]HJL00166.1 serine/threonine-protein kinase [Polyangiaceae bacterium LLY-WYZ-15_(1-7)]HJL08914.1 serine/threonine-protein kinase [Polyangiaceae bacterium LLY-WYZ-15_(1-7)]HJL27242.1 serine/threonine-protein kinase [Polyangiaceae bacterium LLY-WYZ-15_(1-7)]HJL32579.1 serine/threonine-protein kinase [Polyangiaceae bacterium LLY-WYZ-15_(1-7)]
MTTEAPKDAKADAADPGEGSADADAPDAADAQAKKPPPAPSGRRKKGPDPLIGRVINDRFRITSVIARGGMGKVYRAEQAPLGREVALKILNPNYSGEHDPEFHKRFFLEASICAKLTHPNTVTIFDYGRTDDDVYYIAMELLEGRTLHRTLRDESRLPAERAMHVARQVCRSLREAHGLGVIHRDLKPANIFLVKHGDEKDFVKVLDFGLVKDLEKQEDLTQTGLFMGSPKYMSPEQIRGEKVDARCDVYALAVILYEMLCGKVPFDRPNSVNILMAHVHEKPPSMNDLVPEAAIDPRLEQVVMKGMAKNADERYGSMDEFLVALKQTAAQSGLAVSRSGETALSGEFAISGGSTGSYPSVQITGEGSGSVPNVTPSGALQPPIAQDDSMTTGDPFADPNRKGKGILFAGAVLLLAALVGGYFALSGDEEPSEPIADSSTTETEPEPPEPEPPTMEATMEAASTMEASAMGGEAAGTGMDEVARLRVTLRSEPAGATVVVGEHEYGPTPAEVEWTGEEAAMGREVTFQFQLADHRDFTVTRTLVGEDITVEATLDPIRRRRWRRPTTPMMTSSMGDSPSIGIKGYKLEPY